MSPRAKQEVKGTRIKHLQLSAFKKPYTPWNKNDTHLEALLEENIQIFQPPNLQK